MSEERRKEIQAFIEQREKDLEQSRHETLSFVRLITHESEEDQQARYKHDFFYQQVVDYFANMSYLIQNMPDNPDTDTIKWFREAQKRLLVSRAIKEGVLQNDELLKKLDD